MARARLILRAALAAFAILAAPGCWHEEIDQTMPPYASTSDDARDPASAPKPVAVPEVVENPSPDEPQGFAAKTGHAIATVVLFPFRMIADGLEWIF